MKRTTLNRRGFLIAAAAGAGAIPIVSKNGIAETNDEGIPLRKLGRHDEKVTMLALGGHHLGRITDANDNKDKKASIHLTRLAIDRGITFLDNAWCYHDGYAEELMGDALRDGYRKKVFLMTKVHGRDKQGAMAHLEEILKRFHTDMIDLWQFHDLRQEDPDKIFAANGAIEAAVEARKAGKIRYIGYTGHNNYEIHRRMLTDFDFEWDTVQMPINVLDPHYRSFLKNIVPVLVERGIAPIAMKTMAAGRLLETGTVTVEQGLHYVWSQPVATLVSGIASEEHLEYQIRAAKNFTPLSAEEQEAFLKKTQEYAQKGEFENYKAKV